MPDIIDFKGERKAKTTVIVYLDQVRAQTQAFGHVIWSLN